MAAHRKPLTPLIGVSMRVSSRSSDLVLAATSDIVCSSRNDLKFLHWKRNNMPRIIQLWAVLCSISAQSGLSLPEMSRIRRLSFLLDPCEADFSSPMSSSDFGAEGSAL